MRSNSLHQVVRHLRLTTTEGDEVSPSDAQLLERFIERHDEAAFEGLVRQHGPMVLGVCRRLLRHSHDADDAFQATFLVLVRKAASIRPREKVGHWLYGVAYLTARKARARAIKRRRRERSMAALPEPEVLDVDPWDELQCLLDQEVSRLPEKYRVPIVLCDLEGKSGREAARQLGWPEGTLSGRLCRARTLLARRLTQRGVLLAGGVLGVLLTQKGSASVPLSLVTLTVKAALATAAGSAAAVSVLSANVAALTEGVLKAMLLNKLKTVVAVLLVVATATLGGNLLIRPAVTVQPPTLEREDPREKKPVAEAPRDENVRLEIIAQGKGMTVKVAFGAESLYAEAERVSYDEGKKLLVLEGTGANSVKVRKQRGQEVEEIQCQKMMYSLKERRLQIIGAGELKSRAVGLTEKDLGLSLEAVSWTADSGAPVGIDPRILRGGLKVVKVERDSLAERSGIRAGDVILGLHHWETLSLENVSSVLSAASSQGLTRLKFQLLRDTQIVSGFFDVPQP